MDVVAPAVIRRRPETAWDELLSAYWILREQNSRPGNLLAYLTDLAAAEPPVRRDEFRMVLSAEFDTPDAFLSDIAGSRTE